MIPIFPNSKKLELSDRAEIERITKKFLPYSDFNFTSMWSWNTQKRMSISKLNGNLVVRFTDYQTEKPFYSFLGVNDHSGTAHALLKLSKKQGLEPRLKLMPKESISSLDESFLVEEDPDNFDYIYDMNHLETYADSDLKVHRWLVRKFKESHEGIISRELDISDKEVQKEILRITKLWGVNKSEAGKEVNPHHELSAIKNFFLISGNKKLVGLGIFDEDRMIGFAIDELLNSGLAINHFLKGDAANYKGMFSYLMQQNSQFLISKHRNHLNFEQDLGLPGLKHAKGSFRPIYFLKKYRVTLK